MVGRGFMCVCVGKDVDRQAGGVLEIGTHGNLSERRAVGWDST